MKWHENRKNSVYFSSFGLRFVLEILLCGGSSILPKLFFGFLCGSHTMVATVARVAREMVLVYVINKVFDPNNSLGK